MSIGNFSLTDILQVEAALSMTKFTVRVTPGNADRKGIDTRLVVR